MTNWDIPEKIYTPPTEEISAIRRGRGQKFISDNSKSINKIDVFWNNPLVHNGPRAGSEFVVMLVTITDIYTPIYMSVVTIEFRIHYSPIT
jgi:hypothetical protein